MRPSSIEYLHQMDQQLKNQYHQICFNPKKKEVLLRLTDNNQQLAQEGFTLQKLDHGGISNNLLKRYINGVYQKYGIQDPIKRQFRLAKRNQSFTINVNGSPQKSLNLTQVTQSDRLTKTKRKLINLKESFKQDNQDIISSSNILPTQTNLSLRESNFMINRSRISRQIGYKTKEKIYFKTLPKDDVIKELPRPIIKHQFSVQRSDHSKITISFNNPQTIATKKEIPIVFRYCPMCQQPILQNNILYHQTKCKDIQVAYQMPYAYLEEIVINKIRRIEKEISNQFINKDERVIISEFNRLKQLVKSWVTQTNNTSFDQLKNRFQHFAGSTHQKITKLNWFKNLHKKIVMQKSLQSSSLR